ncbi:MAG: Flp pilus assembly protein CpaB [Jatrophihabitans sp.]
MASNLLRSVRATLIRVGSGPRYAAAAVCVLLAVVSGIEDAQSVPRPEQTPTAPVVVTSRAVATGHVLTSRDVRIAHWPRTIRPPGAAIDPRALVGRRLAGPLAVGEPVTPRRLVDPGLADGLDRNTVAVQVDVDTDVRGLVQPGGRVDLIAVPRDIPSGGASGATGRTTPTARTVCKRTLVLTVLPHSAAESVGTQVVLAVDRAQGLLIAGLRTTQLFTFVTADP